MLQHLSPLTRRWRHGDIADATYAGSYFLLWQIECHGKRFASRRAKTDPRPDGPVWKRDMEQLAADALRNQLADWFARYQFLEVIPNVPAALYHWLNGTWSLQLLERIPTPAEVLDMQAAGTRPVTVLAEFPRLLAPVLGKANAFAFMVHDLEHAYKFMHDPVLRDRQIDFFRSMQRCMTAGWLTPYVDDALFAHKFDYLISDMNTHPAHSLQYLRAILIDFHLRHEGKPAEGQVSSDAWRQVCAVLDAAGTTEG